MASIVENKKYGENHKVQLKDKPTNVALFRKEGYRPGQTIFLITRKKVKVNKLLPLTDGKKQNLMSQYAQGKIDQKTLQISSFLANIR